MLDTIECKVHFQTRKHGIIKIKKYTRILHTGTKIGELLGIPLLINLDILHSCELCVTNNTSYLGYPG